MSALNTAAQLSDKTIASICLLAEQAGKEILRIYQSGEWSVTSKADESPVTQADYAANKILVPGLTALTSEPIVSEESDPQSVAVAQDFWLIDPLDGTRDFIGRRDTFVVCVGLVRAKVPVFGVIHSPVTGETWWAAKGQGCFGPGGKKLFRTDQRQPLIAAGSRSMSPERAKNLKKQLGIGEIQQFGSALKFCKLAEGVIDVYPRFGPTCEWDTAAGQIIAEEAGCKVLSLTTGERLQYAKDQFENRGGFIAVRGDLDLMPRLRASGLIPRP